MSCSSARIAKAPCSPGPNRECSALSCPDQRKLGGWWLNGFPGTGLAYRTTSKWNGIGSKPINIHLPDRRRRTNTSWGEHAMRFAAEKNGRRCEERKTPNRAVIFLHLIICIFPLETPFESLKTIARVVSEQ